MKQFLLILIFLIMAVNQAKSQPGPEIIPGKIIEKSRTVSCSVDSVWWKWTTHEGLLTFFGYDHKINLAPGGEYEIYFIPGNPVGLKGGEGNKILSYLPNKMLSFTWNAPPQYPEIRNHEHKTWVVVDYRPINDNNTEVKISHLGWLPGDNWDEVYNYFNLAWVTVLDWLESSCES